MARNYIQCIAQAVGEKCAEILAKKNAMSLLSDGSQARKTKSDKEMVMVRFENNGKYLKYYLVKKIEIWKSYLVYLLICFVGLPCYIFASLLEMAEWGGTGADALKKGIDSIFKVDGPLPLEDYQTKMVSCTADGASVNFGTKNGLLTQLDSDRGWLIKIHCANHRIELAIKDAMKNSSFNEIDNLYISLYNLAKNLGKIKTELKLAAEALNIQHYTLPKLKGTRFVGHRITVIDMWPAIIIALQHVRADSKTPLPASSRVCNLEYNYSVTLLIAVTQVLLT